MRKTLAITHGKDNNDTFNEHMMKGYAKKTYHMPLKSCLPQKIN